MSRVAGRRTGETLEKAKAAGSNMKEHKMEPIDATEAGEQYADEQVDSNSFRDWVREQMVEADRMRRRDPSSVLDDPREIARNMLQQLRWDIHRDLDPREVLGADPDRQQVKEFFAGLDERLREGATVAWLTELVEEEMGEVSAQRRLPGVKMREKRQAQAEPFKDINALAHRQKASHSGQIMWVEMVPGDRGKDWSYTSHADKAVQLSPYWQRRFAADMDRVNDGAVFIPAREMPVHAAPRRSVPPRRLQRPRRR